MCADVLWFVVVPIACVWGGGFCAAWVWDQVQQFMREENFNESAPPLRAGNGVFPRQSRDCIFGAINRGFCVCCTCFLRPSLW